MGGFKHVPKVVGAVFVGDDNDGYLGVVFYRVGTVGCVGEVLCRISRKGLEYRFSVAASARYSRPKQHMFVPLHQVRLPALQCIALDCARLLRGMVERKAG